MSGIRFFLEVSQWRHGRIRLGILGIFSVIGQKNLSGVYKKERLLLLINEVDPKSEACPLSAAKRGTKRKADECLANLRRDEETKWPQRAEVKHMQDGGKNTKYFHLVANGKHRKKSSSSLNKMKGL
jgi:hypothetical protein